MNARKKNIVILVIFALCAGLITWWLIKGSPDAETEYAHGGYIVDVNQSADGTVLTILNASGKTNYTITDNTQTEFKSDSSTVKLGDYIKLNTAKNSTNIKKCLIYNAYSSDGKLINVEGEDSPVLITSGSSSGSFRIYKLMAAEGTIPDLPTGTPVTVFYQYELNAGTERIVFDVLETLSDSPIPLTENERNYIELMDYVIAGTTAE